MGHKGGCWQVQRRMHLMYCGIPKDTSSAEAMLGTELQPYPLLDYA